MLLTLHEYTLCEKVTLKVVINLDLKLQEDCPSIRKAAEYRSEYFNSALKRCLGTFTEAII